MPAIANSNSARRNRVKRRAWPVRRRGTENRHKDSVRGGHEASLKSCFWPSGSEAAMPQHLVGIRGEFVLNGARGGKSRWLSHGTLWECLSRKIGARKKSKRIIYNSDTSLSTLRRGSSPPQRGRQALFMRA